MERRFNEAEVRLDNHGFSGHAVRFYDPQEQGTEYEIVPGLYERISPTALDRTLRENRDVKALDNHNPDIILARSSAGTLTLKKDAKGLRYNIDYNKADPDHRRIKAKVESRAYKGSSFGFYIRSESFIKDGQRDVRLIEDLDLAEVSMVIDPAYGATATKFRSNDKPDEVLKRYQDWRDTQEAIKNFLGE